MLSSDERLAQRATGGDRRAFATIYRRYGQSLYRFCLSIVGNAEDAGDALQSTMVKALQALPGEERRIQLKPWLYRVAHNESVEILRKRRDAVEFADDLSAPGGEPAETTSQRERLRQLLRDLAELPERQRSALVMRELGGLPFEQIGEAFETSAAVARQTVYEARLGLRQLEEGREMSCGEAMRQLSDTDRRVWRRRSIQAHLRACPDCRSFAGAIEERRHDLAALTPLPAVASTVILQAVLGGGHGAAGGAATRTAVAASSVLAKSVATVAVAATVGVSAADRGGLVDLGLPGGGSEPAVRQAVPEGGTDQVGTTAGSRAAAQAGSGQTRAGDKPGPAPDGGKPAGAGYRPAAATGHGPPASMPQASDHGQQTAAKNRAQRGSQRSKPHSRGPHPQSGAHHGASHGQSGVGASPKGGAGAGTGKPQAQPGGDGPETAPQSPPADTAPGGSTGSSTSVGNKSSTHSAP